MRRVLSVDSGAAQFSFSRSGSLVYLPGGAAAGVRRLFLFNRKGVGEPLKLTPGSYSYPRVSPDGKRLAFQSNSGNDSFISIYDLSGTGAARRLTFGGNGRFPVWSADSRSVVFQSDRDGSLGVFRQSIDGGGAEPLTRPDPGTSHVPEAWSPEGDFLLFNVAARNETALWILSARDGKTRPFGDVSSTLLPTDAVFSPDGRWVAYQAGGQGAGEGAVFVQPFPPNGTKHQIAQGGRPLWSHDGKELFFLPGPGQLRVVSVATQPTFTFTDPVPVPRGFGVSGPLNPREFDMTPQGLIVGTGSPTQAPAGSMAAAEVRVVVNWFEEVKARAPAR
jgi:eukaryotic-like serine/threonine-protein kinase